MNSISLNDVLQRLAKLEAIEAIKQLKARYLNGCDRQDAELVRSCFADGEINIDMGYFGRCSHRDEFVDGIFVPRGCHEYVLDMHHAANPEITLHSAQAASAIWSLNYRNINTQQRTLTLLSALYHDEYMCSGGEWKIVSSRTEYRTVLSCSYQSGSLQLGVAARSLAAVDG